MPDKTFKKQSLWRLLTLLALPAAGGKPVQWKYIAGLSARVILTTGERLFIACILKLLVDAVTAGDKVQFRSTLIGWIAFYIGFTLISPFILYLWRSAVYEGTANIREVIFRHLQRLPLGYHELHHSGDALSILTNDAAAAEKAYQEDLYILVEAWVQGVAAGILMLFMNWQLALLIILSGLAPLGINTLFAAPLRKVGQELQGRLGTLSERMGDLLAGFQVVRTFSLGEWILERFDQANQRVLESSLHRVRLDAALASGNEFAGIFTFLPLIIGAYLTLIGQTTLGTYLMLIQLSNQINNLVYALGGVISRVQSALAAADRIFALLDSPLEPERVAMPRCGNTETASIAIDPISVPASPQAGEGSLGSNPDHPPSRDTEAASLMIEFRDVVFGYNGGDLILNSISFSVPHSQFVAFAGPSGGGKSTLFKLLLGCYPLRSGSIYVSGRRLNDYRLTDLRELIAYVPQDAYLFSGSILENLRYGKPGASEAEIQSAARAAFAHDFVMEFPQGYQTVVGERGARLSGGQRQRIAIARALLKDAPILLLDEATSALDSESEQIVQQALEVLMKGRTTLVIAHRFSTIVHADQIYVIADGRLAEHGGHSDLINQSGIYAALYETSLKR